MKHFTLFLFIGLIFLFFQPIILQAQNNSICTDFDASLVARGIECGAQKGVIEVNVKNGSGQYQIEWDNANYTIWDKTNSFGAFYSIGNLPSGNYTVRIKDLVYTCEIKRKIFLPKNVLPNGLNLTGNAIDCKGVGTISASIPNDTPPFHIALRGPISAHYVANSNSFKFYNLPAGEYEVDFIKDGCVATTSTIIEDKDGLPKLSLLTVKGNCDISTGAIVVNINDGQSPYVLSWEGTSKGSIELTETKEIKGFHTGSYQFTLKDANGCKSFSSAEIDRSGMSVALTSSSTKCNQNGSIKVEITGGQAPYLIKWRGGEANEEGSKEVVGIASSLSLPKGTYIIEIMDSNGCSTFSNTSIIEAPTDLYCSITPKATTCNEINGAINVFISGGTPPYSLTYEGSVSGSAIVTKSTTFENLPPGTYTTFLQDADGCAVSETSEVQIHPFEEATANFSYSATGTSVFFFNNSTAGFYFWDFGDGTTSNAPSPTHNFGAAGSYEVCLTTTGDCDSKQFCQTLQIVALKNISGLNLQIEEGLEMGNKSSSIEEDRLKIIQNYPNPFVNKTNILFELPEALFSTILIHDNTGRIVQRHDAFYPKGINLFTFNQNNLASGIYYYTIKAGNFSSNNKMVIR